jgi:hypothetical protein
MTAADCGSVVTYAPQRHVWRARAFMSPMGEVTSMRASCAPSLWAELTAVDWSSKRTVINARSSVPSARRRPFATRAACSAQGHL